MKVSLVAEPDGLTVSKVDDDDDYDESFLDRSKPRNCNSEVTRDGTNTLEEVQKNRGNVKVVMATRRQPK